MDTLPFHETERLSHSVGGPAEKLKAATRGVKRRAQYRIKDIMKGAEGEKDWRRIFKRKDREAAQTAATVTTKGTTGIAPLLTTTNHKLSQLTSLPCSHHYPNSTCASQGRSSPSPHRCASLFRNKHEYLLSSRPTFLAMRGCNK